MVITNDLRISDAVNSGMQISRYPEQKKHKENNIDSFWFQPYMVVCNFGVIHSQ